MKINTSWLLMLVIALGIILLNFYAFQLPISTLPSPSESLFPRPIAFHRHSSPHTVLTPPPSPPLPPTPPPPKQPITKPTPPVQPTVQPQHPLDAPSLDPQRKGGCKLTGTAPENVVALLVITCKRPDYLKRSLDGILKYLPSDHKVGDMEYCLIISQDCDESGIDRLLATEPYASRISGHIKHPGFLKVPPTGPEYLIEPKLAAYEAISKHYKWALGQIFDTMKFASAVVLEEDIDVAPDFFEYFSSLIPILRQDSSLFCISAWNDNGFGGVVEDPKALYRTDIFPGLGWALTRQLWDELRDKWARAYWDEFMRLPRIRNRRQCIRPEISRTYHFGEKGGVSEGQFQPTHLSRIKINTTPVKWTEMDLTNMLKKRYDADLQQAITESKFIKSPQSLESMTEKDLTKADGSPMDVKLAYGNEEDFVSIARRYQLMEEWKEKLPRTSYKGVVVFRFRKARVFLCPNAVAHDPATLTLL